MLRSGGSVRREAEPHVAVSDAALTVQGVAPSKRRQVEEQTPPPTRGGALRLVVERYQTSLTRDERRQKRLPRLRHVGEEHHVLEPRRLGWVWRKNHSGYRKSLDYDASKSPTPPPGRKSPRSAPRAPTFRGHPDHSRSRSGCTGGACGEAPRRPPPAAATTAARWRGRGSGGPPVGGLARPECEASPRERPPLPEAGGLQYRRAPVPMEEGEPEGRGGSVPAFC